MPGFTPIQDDLEHSNPSSSPNPNPDPDPTPTPIQDDLEHYERQDGLQQAMRAA